MSEHDAPSALADHLDAVSRALLDRIGPYLRPIARAHELNATWTPLPLDPAWAVGLHTRDRTAGDLTVGDRDHDTGIPLALLEDAARTRLPA